MLGSPQTITTAIKIQGSYFKLNDFIPWAVLGSPQTITTAIKLHTIKDLT